MDDNLLCAGPMCAVPVGAVPVRTCAVPVRGYEGYQCVPTVLHNTLALLQSVFVNLLFLFELQYQYSFIQILTGSCATSGPARCEYKNVQYLDIFGYNNRVLPYPCCTSPSMPVCVWTPY